MNWLFRTIFGVFAFLCVAVFVLVLLVILIPLFVVGLIFWVILLVLFFVIGIFLSVYFWNLKRKMKKVVKSSRRK